MKYGTNHVTVYGANGDIHVAAVMELAGRHQLGEELVHELVPISLASRRQCGYMGEEWIWNG